MTTSKSVAAINIRLAIVVPYSGLDAIPFLCDLSEYLAAHGYLVDIFVKEDAGFVRPEFSSDRIRVLPFPGPLGRKKSASSTPPASPRRITRGLSKIPGWPRAWRVASQIREVVTALDPTRRVRWRRVARLPYRVVIGVDAEGLLAAATLSKVAHAALGYYSLELLPSWDLTSLGERTLKWREARLSRGAALVIVQDPTRGRILVEDNGIDSSRFVYAPNAPSGAARRAPSRWWHDRFDFPDDRRVLLHAGGLGTWTGIDGLVEAAGDLPDDWVLVVHSHDHRRDAARIEQLRTRAPVGKVFFSDSSASRQQYRAHLDGADAGVAFYIPEPTRWTMTNLTSLGLASGKFAYYLWCGLPVIVNSTTSLGELVDRETVGIRVDSASELGEAVRSVATDYQLLSDRAVQYFNAELDFAASAERIGMAVDGLARERR
jgi:glycosyltransferase involved in cell wall biosynthesis